jgi:hypothetical protein
VKITYSFHKAKSFLRSYMVLSYLRNSPHFMEPKGSLPPPVPILNQINPVQAPSIPLPEANLVPLFPLLRLYQRISQGLRHMYPFCKKASYYGGELLPPHANPKLENHTLSVVHDCLLNIFTAALHIGGCSSIHNLRTRCAVVTEIH